MKNRNRINLITRLRSAHLLCLIFFGLLLAGYLQTASAAETGSVYSAVAFYDKYGSQVIFLPTSESDGVIYYATRGRASSSVSNTSYDTVGWNMTLMDSKGNSLEVLYLEPGEELQLLQESSRDDYLYRLYGITLSSVKSRLGRKSLSVLEHSSCSVKLDACLIVKNAGISDGKVYTSYAQILRAADWTSGTQEALRKYFNREIQGLFFRVSAEGDEGIASVEGGGSYCYGAQALLQARVKDHYLFTGWTCEDGQQYEEPAITFRVTENTSWKASARSNYPPEIEAGDRYYPVSDARAGLITEEEILSHYYISDQEDLSEDLDIQLAGLNQQLLLEAEDGDSQQLVISVVDTDGNRTEKEVTIYLVDTAIKSGRQVTGTIRFISGKYFENNGVPVAESDGGLQEHSIWWNNPGYRELLKNLLTSQP